MSNHPVCIYPDMHFQGRADAALIHEYGCNRYPEIPCTVTASGLVWIAAAGTAMLYGIKQAAGQQHGHALLFAQFAGRGRADMFLQAAQACFPESQPILPMPPPKLNRSEDERYVEELELTELPLNISIDVGLSPNKKLVKISFTAAPPINTVHTYALAGLEIDELIAHLQHARRALKQESL